MHHQKGSTTKLSSQFDSHNNLFETAQSCGGTSNGFNNNNNHTNNNNNNNIESSHNLKSNLKKTTTLVKESQSSTEKRKVSWPDSHGKDIAHVQEFEQSISGEGELGGVKNSCICVIQ